MLLQTLPSWTGNDMFEFRAALQRSHLGSQGLLLSWVPETCIQWLAQTNLAKFAVPHAYLAAHLPLVDVTSSYNIFALNRLHKSWLGKI